MEDEYTSKNRWMSDAPLRRCQHVPELVEIWGMETGNT